MFPRTATGRSSLVPPPPWHYSGSMLTVEFRADPAAVAELLPAPLEPADEDPGAVAVIWADWQSCSDTFEELLDPVRAQYLETFVVVRCRYDGQTYSRCAYIWVDRDFAMVRGHHQGYPKKLGELYVTRPGQRRRGRAPAGAGRSVRGDVLGVRPAAHRRHVHDHRLGPDGRLRQRPPDAALAGVPGHRERRHRQPRRARHDARLRRRGRPGVRRRRHDRLLRLARRGADPPGAGRDDRRLLAGGRHELAGRHHPGPEQRDAERATRPDGATPERPAWPDA